MIKPVIRIIEVRISALGSQHTFSGAETTSGAPPAAASAARRFRSASIN
jgi:hypothetical protein